MTSTESRPKVELLSSLFEYQAGIFNNALQNLDDQRALQRPTASSNHSNWLVGHIVHCRYMLLNMMGLQLENPLGDLYWSALDESREYLSLEKLSSAFSTVSGELQAALEDLNDEQLSLKTSEEKPSIQELASFFAYHEAYHLGQLGYARKQIGLDAMKSH